MKNGCLILATAFAHISAVSAEQVARCTVAENRAYAGISAMAQLTTAEFTVEAWVKPESFLNGMPIVTQSPDANRVQFSILKGAKGHGCLGLLVNGKDPQTVLTEVYVPLNAWTHVALARNSSSFTVFTNGVSVFTYNCASDYVAPPAGRTITVGGFQSQAQDAGAEAPSYTFPGCLSDVRVWNVPRTGEQIMANKDRRLTGAEDGLVAYFPLNHKLGNTTPEYVTGDDCLLGTVWTIQDDEAFVLAPADGSRTAFAARPVLSGGAASSAVNPCVSTGDKLAVESDVTMEAWVKLPSVDASGQLCSQYASGGGRMIWFVEKGALVLQQGNCVPKNVLSSSKLPAKTWTHVACTRDFTAKRVCFYINGKLESSTDCTTLIGFNQGGPFGILGYDSPFNGCVRELRVWTNVLSQAEIESRMSYSLDGKMDGLFQCWPLDDNCSSLRELVSGKTCSIAADAGFTWRSDTVPSLERTGKTLTLQPTFTGGLFTFADTKVSLGAVTSFTLEAWINPTRTPHGSKELAYIVTQSDGSDNAACLELLADGRPALAQNTQVLAAAESVRYGVWTHVAAVRDGESWALYVNGKQVAVGQFPNVPATPEDFIRIGNWGYGPANNKGAFSAKGWYNSFNGSIREVRVWNVARAKRDIAADYNRKVAEGTSGLVGYWPMEFTEGAGTLSNGVDASAGAYRLALLPQSFLPPMRDPREGLLLILK